MLERKLYGPLVDGADYDDWLLYRIADGTAGYKPWDIGGADNYGIAVGLEVKVSAEPLTAESEPLPWKQFETRQRSWLNEFAHHRCLALIALYYEKAGEMRVYRLAGGPDDLPRSHYAVGALAIHDKVYRGWRALAIPRAKAGVPRRIKEK